MEVVPLEQIGMIGIALLVLMPAIFSLNERKK